jgi:hypothetical protein
MGAPARPARSPARPRPRPARAATALLFQSPNQRRLRLTSGARSRLLLPAQARAHPCALQTRAFSRWPPAAGYGEWGSICGAKNLTKIRPLSSSRPCAFLTRGGPPRQATATSSRCDAPPGSSDRAPDARPCFGPPARRAAGRHHAAPRGPQNAAQCRPPSRLRPRSGRGGRTGLFGRSRRADGDLPEGVDALALRLSGTLGPPRAGCGRAGPPMAGQGLADYLGSFTGPDRSRV